MYLDELEIESANVGYGKLGLMGDLGYEGKSVFVKQKSYHHALSSHPPAHLIFNLDCHFKGFNSQVAINDDVAPNTSYADFSVLADGELVAVAPYVVAGEPPRTLNADIAGAKRLELIVKTSRWPFSHAVWLDPQVSELSFNSTGTAFLDCLGRIKIFPPSKIPHGENCIATIVSPGFETLLDDMLGSLCANGNCQNAIIAVFGVGNVQLYEKVIAKYGATLIRCQPHARVNATVKAALYSVARIVYAEKFICLDADMLVLGDLCPIFAALDALPDGSILACREANGDGFIDLRHALRTVYGGRDADFQRLLSTSNNEAMYSLVVNDGIFAGSRTALMRLDNTIRDMPQAARWTDERKDIWWRNQFVFNLALAKLLSGVELETTYNVQLNSQDVQFCYQEGRIKAIWRGIQAKVIHFNGLGRNKYAEWKNLFARVSDPLMGKFENDYYAIFLSALRAWIGRHGLSTLAWSFYGTANSQNAQVNDPGTFPLFALLHYLIRANGCARVLETGTARGVSAACLASAISHRDDACLVTFDTINYPEREQLWAALPQKMRNCIIARTIDSINGMKAAINAGEQYHAVLLDSIHSAEHVWAEFKLAVKLVCPGGLILIHDACCSYGTVGQAIQYIQGAGYGVTRLWAAEDGIYEDDHLGLAVVENRRFSAGHLKTTKQHC